MDVKEIPWKIFEKISSNCGMAAPAWSYKGKDYQVSQLLDPEKKKVIGFMCYRQDKEECFTILYFWWKLPGKDDTSTEPALFIKAGPVDIGVWAFGKGRQMQERLVLHFPHREIPGSLALNRPLGFAISYGAELIQVHDCRGVEFWEKDRFPEGIFVTPP
ncbi:MAG: hypothetical protein WC460_01195 [Patescibacteria group bacterium]